jgi:protocatechuate 3,4-dioxygenase alpha subunit
VAARTPSQTVGPFFHEALRWNDDERVSSANAGPMVTLAGRVLDGAGTAVSDAIVEAWHGASGGVRRMLTGPDGSFRLESPMPAGDIPHVEILVFARGLLKPVRTRAYLVPIERVRSDPALAALGASPRLATLVATPAGEREYRWDIHLQGPAETVFFLR